MISSDRPSDRIPAASISDYLAAERTFLAWIRTGLALMGFGFVIARFGIFLQEFQDVQHLPSMQSNGVSLWFGTVVIAVGVIVNVFAGYNHIRLVRQLNRGMTGHFRPSTHAIAIAFFLALVGLAMAIYLVSIRNTTTKGKEPSMTPGTDNGIINVPSNHTVDQTVEKLQKILESKGVKVFALVDHSGEAEKAGMKMPPTKLLIFGNPKAGTPLMLAAPSIAIDLPLKILVWQDKQEKVWLSYNSLEYLQARHNLPADLLKNIAVVQALASNAAG